MARIRKTKSKRKQTLGKASVQAGKRFNARKKIRRATEHKPRRVFVFIHGAGSFSEDWYKPTIEYIEKELGHPFDFLPVYFADLATRPLGTLAETPAQSKFKTDFQKELEKSFATSRSSASSEDGVSVAALPEEVERIVGTVRLVADYFFAPGIRAEIQKRLIDQLNQAKAYDEIVLVAHSLGSIVCFDVLKQRAAQYNISFWFTTGSALAKLRRIGIYDDSLGAITTRQVKRWGNIYDTTDWIGDPLGPAFPKPGYRLFDIFVNVGLDPNASHNYLLNPEVIKLFADALREG